jgi:glucose dehydrogenase
MPKINRRTFLKIAGGSATAALVGYLGWDRLSPNIEVKRFSDLDSLVPFDFCIIASAQPGPTLGKELVGRGLRTMILESGDEIGKEGYDERILALDTYLNSGELDYPLAATRVRAVGGTSTVWSGVSPRLNPQDFEENAYTPARSPWPLSYSDLEPYYEKAERTLRVRGGEISEFNPPRKENLPPPVRSDISTLKPVFDQVDVTIDPLTISQASWVDKRPVRAADHLLPGFSASRHAALVTGTTVTRLLINSSGRVFGAVVRNLDQEEKILEAKTFVVAGGGIETTRLLLLSTSPEYPEGIGNNADQVGRYFMEHPIRIFSVVVPGLVADKEENARCYQFYEQAKENGGGGVLIGVRVASNRSGFLRFSGGIEMYPSAENRIQLARDKKDLFGNPAAELSFRFSDEDFRTNEVVESSIRDICRRLDVRQIEEGEIFWSHHHMGTCRMGRDSNLSVVDKDLRVHETENLFILSSAVFVTSGVGNPTLTIVALAHRLADHLSQQ